MHRSNFLGSRAVLAAAAALSVALGVQAALPGGAAASWCFDDPVIQIGDTMVETTVGVAADPAFIAAHVKGATITYYLPENVPHAKVRATLTPYFAETVVFKSNGLKVQKGQPIPVTITVSFQSDVALPAQMVNTAQSAAKGPQKQPAQGVPVGLTTFGTTTVNGVSTHALVNGERASVFLAPGY